MRLYIEAYYVLTEYNITQILIHLLRYNVQVVIATVYMYIHSYTP